MKSITTTTASHQPLETLNIHDMIERLSDMLTDSIYRGHKICNLLHRMNQDAWKESTYKQAASQRSLLPLAIKAGAAALGVLQIGVLAAPTATLQKIIPQFIQLKAKRPEELSKLVCQLIKPTQEISNFFASVVETHETANRTEWTMEGEIAHSTSETAMRRSMELDGELQKTIQMLQSVRDALRTSLQVMNTNKR